MATTVISSVGSGKDYSTIAAWYAAKKGDLVTADTIQIAEVYGTVTETACYLAAANSTVDSTHYFHIRAASGQEFKGDLGNLTGQARVYTAFSSSYPYVLYTDIQYTVIENLVFEGPTTEASFGVYGIRIYTQYCKMINCAVRNIKGYSSNRITCYGIYGSTYAPTLINCLVDNVSARSTSSKTASAYGIFLGSGGKAYNCTVTNLTCTNSDARGGAYGFSGSNVSGMTAINCLCGNLTSNKASLCFNSGMSSSCKNNASTDATAGTYTDGIDNVTLSDEITTTTAGSVNCKLKTGADCIDEGYDLSADFTDDISGYTRTTPWDIGAWEWRAALGVKWNGITISKWNGIAISKLNGVA